MQASLGRLLTAMVTPFDAAGAVDLDVAARLACALVASGSDGVVVNGTTGESPTLSHVERLALLRAVRRALPDHAVVMGTGSNSTAATVQATQEAKEEGADAALVVAPYYNKPPQEGLIAHFEAVADAGLPVVVYNIPGRTGVNLTVETTLTLARHPHICGTKEAAGDADQVARIVAGAPPGFRVWSGDDGLTLPFMSVGAHGVVSVVAHVCGAAMRRMIEAQAAGDTAAAAALHARLLPIFEGLFVSSNPIPVKAALTLLGHRVGGLRLPLVEADEAEIAAVRSALERLGLLAAVPA
ncbi:MAG: 4-hydroxy-tetrahydrodipicolinate synthase [Candidatus Dormibacteria bacterium]